MTAKATIRSGRRGHGEGSIYQRTSDGRWIATVELGWRNGKRARKTVSGKTRREAAEKQKKLLYDQQQGLPIQVERQTVAQFLDTWLADVVKPSVRPTTHRSYAGIVRLHLRPGLGHHQLTKLTPQHVQAFLNVKSTGKLTPRSVQYLRDVLRNALNQAVKWDLVPRNVATLVEPPRVEIYEPNFLTPVQARTLLATARGERLEALLAVALGMGLRQGEAMGLLWSDVDLVQGMLRVRRQLQRTGGTLQLVELKTGQSRRTLIMPPTVAKALQDHLDRQKLERLAAGAEWQESGLVFTTGKGKPLDARNVSRNFKRLIIKAGLPDLRWHDLRHSCASLLLAQKVPHKVVMETLGHSQISLTMRYSHMIPELQDLAADSMEQVLRNPAAD